MQTPTFISVTACYNEHMLKNLCRQWLLVLFLIIRFTTSVATAQSEVVVTVFPPSFDDFPLIQFDLRVLGPDGRRLPFLSTEDFRITENGNPIETLSIEEVEAGTQQIFVLNSGPGLNVRDPQGVIRFDHLRQALIDFWSQPEAGIYGIDDLSLVTADEILVQHSPSAAELSSALQRTSPSFESETIDWSLLTTALDLMSDGADGQVHKARMLVFFTSIIQETDETELANAIAKAQEFNTAVYPVVYATEELIEDGLTANLIELAEETGGRVMYFSPQLGFSEFGQKLLDQRTLYEVTYDSAVTSSGEQSIEVLVQSDGSEIGSGQVTYQIDIELPEVAFVSPPDTIVRQSDEDSAQVEEISPTFQPLSLLITYPDGIERPIKRSQLIVDGVVVEENLQEPFDQFRWDLTGYIESEKHTLRATVEDEFGLRASTVNTPINVEVTLPPRGLSVFQPALGSLSLAITVLIVGVVLAVLFVSRSRSRSILQGNEGKELPALHQLKRAGLRHDTIEVIEAVLRPLNLDGDPINLTGIDQLIGRDASLSSIVVDDPSIAGIHARLIRQADGDYLIKDQGSVAGTWVNYQEISDDGVRLRHADRIQVGRIKFLFELPGVDPERNIQIIPVTEVYPISGKEHDGESDDQN